MKKSHAEKASIYLLGLWSRSLDQYYPRVLCFVGRGSVHARKLIANKWLLGVEMIKTVIGRLREHCHVVEERRRPEKCRTDDLRRFLEGGSYPSMAVIHTPTNSIACNEETCSPKDQVSKTERTMELSSTICKPASQITRDSLSISYVPSEP